MGRFSALPPPPRPTAGFGNLVLDWPKASWVEPALSPYDAVPRWGEEMMICAKGEFLMEIVGSLRNLGLPEGIHVFPMGFMISLRN